MTYPEQQPSMGHTPQPPLQVVPAVQAAAPPAEPAPSAEPQDTPRELPEGWFMVTLRTADGEADLAVPPMDDWRATAKNAAFTRGDELAWAVETLSAEDSRQWLELNPTGRETREFFTEWGRLVGLAEGNRAHRRAQGRR